MRKLSRWVAGLLALAGWMTAMAQAGGSFGVSDSGLPGYSYPIGVPPGVAGIEPKLSLQYSGAGVNGPVGLGWFIQGFSTISRCSAIPVIDGKRVAVKYATTDHLCMDGARLIQVTPSAANDSTYSVGTSTTTNDAAGVASGYVEFRTETDQYSRIRAFGSAGGSSANGPAYFQVWTKSGLVYEYGNTTDSQITVTNAGGTAGTVVSVWAVDKVSDTVGNFMQFKYTVLRPIWGSGASSTTNYGTEWNLAEVWYTGTSTAAPSNKVVFNYATRATPDTSEAYQAGFKNVTTQLLQSVATYVGTNGSATTLAVGSTSGLTQASFHKLAWTSAATTSRSLLQSIAQCSGMNNAACLPPTTFNYYKPTTAPGNFIASTKFNIGTGGTNYLQMYDAPNAQSGHAYGVLTGHFMGTGRTDIIRWQDTASNNQLWSSNGDGSFTQKTLSINSDNLFKSDGCFSAIAADFNGDGLDDILRVANSTNNSQTACPTGSPNLLFINKGNGSFNRIVLPGSISLDQKAATVSTCAYPPICTWVNGANFYVFDVDGDGILDLVTTTLSSNAACGIGQSAGTTQVWKGATATNFGFSFTQISSITCSLYSDPTIRYVVPVPTLDMNGDGYTDLIILHGAWSLSPAAVQLSNGDGTFTSAGLSVGCDRPIDFNGDGKFDCLNLVYNATSSTYTNALLMGSDQGALSTTSTFNLASAALGGTTTSGVVVADFNGDGRGDILAWNDALASNALWFSNGDGSFAAAATTNLNKYQLNKSDGTYTFLVADFTGHGMPEMLLLNSVNSPPGASLLMHGDPNSLVVDENSPDRLISIVSPTGATTSLTWAPLPNTSQYICDIGTGNAASAAAHQSDVCGPTWVVTSSASDNGVGGTTTSTYSYAGLKTDTQGRGALGFRQTITNGPGGDGSNIAVTTNYLQAYPYIGMPANAVTTAGGATVSKTYRDYCDLTATPGTPNPTAAQMVAGVAPCTSTALVNRPYLLANYEQAFDLNGATRPDVLTVNQYDSSHYGNLVAISKTTGTTASSSGGATAQSFQQTMNNTYQTPDSSGSNWVLGRLTASTLTNTVSPGSNGLAAVAGSSTYASSVTGAAALAAASLTVAAANVSVTATSTGQSLTGTTTASVTGSVPPATAPITYSISPAASSTTPPITASINALTGVATFGANSVPDAQYVSGTFTVTAQDAAGRSGATQVTATFGGLPPTSRIVFNGATAVSPSAISASGNNIVSSTSYNNGTLTNAYTLNFTNTGTAAASPVLVLTGLPDLSVGTSTCASVAPNATCQISITVNSTYGANTGSSYSGSWTLSGAGTVPSGTFAHTINSVVSQWGASSSNQSLSFGSVKAGSSATLSIALNNLGNAAANWTALTGLPAGFAANVSGCASVAPGASCSVLITFTPPAAQAYSGSGIYANHTNVTSNTLSVSGTGVAPSVTSASLSSSLVASGSTVTFTWATANATSVSVACSGAGSGSGSGVSGSISVTSSGTGTLTCTVTASDLAGLSASSSASATVYSIAFSPANGATLPQISNVYNRLTCTYQPTSTTITLTATGWTGTLGVSVTGTGATWVSVSPTSIVSGTNTIRINPLQSGLNVTYPYTLKLTGNAYSATYTGNYYSSNVGYSPNCIPQ